MKTIKLTVELEIEEEHYQDRLKEFVTDLNNDDLRNYSDKGIRNVSVALHTINEEDAIIHVHRIQQL